MKITEGSVEVEVGSGDLFWSPLHGFTHEAEGTIFAGYWWSYMTLLRTSREAEIHEQEFRIPFKTLVTVRRQAV